MDLYLRNYETWKQLYNCSYLTANQWASAGEPNIPLGVAYMTIGILFIIIYILCLRIMCEKHIRKHSCLKIMIHIGLMDVTNLCLNSVYSGYQTVTGSVFCSEPTLNYISGAIVMGAWINCSTSAIILSLNRALELMCPYRIETIFGGFRTYLWLLIPNIYGLYFLFFTPAPSFTSKGYAWFFNPYVGFNFTDVNLSQYESPSHSFHNIGSSLVFVLLYVVHFVALWWKTKSSNNEALGKTRKALLIQCCLICSLNFSACVTYVYIEHMKEPPRLLMIIAQALWIGCNCKFSL
ncbi:hypothetical protein L596_030513 [Steinernema carpocapsae]|uniref:G-protein coupled receptors family 1 profile domain-containing protein n=1 Tax=Steinernema carpocapsae TaxID=34508 RepID=A0A4U5LPM6_STECR|nr:hypothetical protein L596_030513 [Steinernema carpocapsae]